MWKCDSCEYNLSENSKPYDNNFPYRNVRFKCKRGDDKRTSGKWIRPNNVFVFYFICI